MKCILIPFPCSSGTISQFPYPIYLSFLYLPHLLLIPKVTGSCSALNLYFFLPFLFSLFFQIPYLPSFFLFPPITLLFFSYLNYIVPVLQSTCALPAKERIFIQLSDCKALPLKFKKSLFSLPFISVNYFSNIFPFLFSTCLLC